MIIRTIVRTNTGFMLSQFLWNDPVWAANHRSSLKGFDDWRWIGESGWFASEENKAIYGELSKHISDLEQMHDGEYEEIDILL